MAVLATCRAQAPDHFRWRTPPYEYETVLPPINILTGSSRIRTLIDSDADWSEVDHAIEDGVDKFRQQCERYLLY